LLTIQKKQAKYFAFRREKAPVESGLNKGLFSKAVATGCVNDCFGISAVMHNTRHTCIALAKQQNSQYSMSIFVNDTAFIINSGIFRIYKNCKTVAHGISLVNSSDSDSDSISYIVILIRVKDCRLIGGPKSKKNACGLRGR
jgi:hypothetical protein